ncbi:hypothetical protein SAMN05421823_11295 [Catalinimonas alkaloidigena]|uniref:Uncharacterized protein n=1 Tax=Catalinimonas alkaloidigena TaxID=1075417 RepID=A0A1G9SBB0_9BACT|nr:hypothetical protein [Catalinimonas alkaloidigena]SDM32630.1 hypothetical protein SAMN05421823_11295 [Catalinimonas alkaloidigena]
MATNVNKSAVAHARQLIRQGQVEKGHGDWSAHQPSTDQENTFIDREGMEAFGKWYLGIETDQADQNKGHYKFPYGDFKRVHRGGLIAAKQRAAQNHYDDIEKAADKLIALIGE